MKDLDQVKQEIKKNLKENNCALTTIYSSTEDKDIIFIAQVVEEVPTYQRWDDHA